MGCFCIPPIHLFKNRVYLQSITGSVDLNSGHFMKLSTPILALDAVGLNQFKPTTMSDFHNTSLDAYEARVNRIEDLDLPAIREYVQEHAGCSLDDSIDWYEQISGRSVPEEQWGAIEEVWEEESQTWEPTDDEMKASFGTKWHDGL